MGHPTWPEGALCAALVGVGVNGEVSDAGNGQTGLLPSAGFCDLLLLRLCWMQFRDAGQSWPRPLLLLETALAIDSKNKLWSASATRQGR